MQSPQEECECPPMEPRIPVSCTLYPIMPTSDCHFGPSAMQNVGDDILQELGAGLDFGPFSISGFGSELGEGTYTFWFQEGNATPNTPPEAHPPGPNDANDFVDYTFEFDVVQVPEPSTTTYLVSLILLGLTPHWRRCRKA